MNNRSIREVYKDSHLHMVWKTWSIREVKNTELQRKVACCLLLVVLVVLHKRHSVYKLEIVIMYTLTMLINICGNILS